MLHHRELIREHDGGSFIVSEEVNFGGRSGLHYDVCIALQSKNILAVSDDSFHHVLDAHVLASNVLQVCKSQYSHLNVNIHMVTDRKSTPRCW